jgi:hypothetical protein
VNGYGGGTLRTNFSGALPVDASAYMLGRYRWCRSWGSLPGWKWGGYAGGAPIRSVTPMLAEIVGVDRFRPVKGGSRVQADAPPHARAVTTGIPKFATLADPTHSAITIKPKHHWYIRAVLMAVTSAARLRCLSRRDEGYVFRRQGYVFGYVSSNECLFYRDAALSTGQTKPAHGQDPGRRRMIRFPRE